MGTRGGFDQLACDPYPCTGFSNASFKKIANAKLAPDLLDVDGLALVRKAGVSRDHKQGFKSRQCSGDFLHRAVCEVLLLGVATHILKWQNGDGRFVGESKRWSLADK